MVYIYINYTNSKKKYIYYIDSYYQMMSTLLKLGLSGYNVKPRFGAFQCEYLLQNPLFLVRKNFGDTRHPYFFYFFLKGRFIDI